MNKIDREYLETEVEEKKNARATVREEARVSVLFNVWEVSK